MSRYNRTATHPETGEKHEAAYGWDEVPPFEPGYFFQVFDNVDPDKAIVNEGMLRGISKERLNELKKQWKVR